jgi:hypothetical protein
MIIENKGGPTQLGIRGKVVKIKPGMHNYANYPELADLVKRNKQLRIIASGDLPEPVKSVAVAETMSEKGQQYTEPEPKPEADSEEEKKPKRTRSKKDKVPDGDDGNTI